MIPVSDSDNFSYKPLKHETDAQRVMLNYVLDKYYSVRRPRVRVHADVYLVTFLGRAVGNFDVYVRGVDIEVRFYGTSSVLRDTWVMKYEDPSLFAELDRVLKPCLQRD